VTCHSPERAKNPTSSRTNLATMRIAHDTVEFGNPRMSWRATLSCARDRRDARGAARM
jgi:hypothetical protein